MGRIFILCAVLFILASPAFADDGLVLVKGGSFTMGSPESEGWRSSDETQRNVTVADFYISAREAVQSDWNAVMPAKDFAFKGDDLPIESVTWIEAVEFCNAKSAADGLTPVYKVDGDTVMWDRAADGWRLPTEAEWEYAARAGSATPFSGAESLGADDANFYGHYPYNIEQNYFTQEKLDIKPGHYRGRTLTPGSFSPNALGLFDIHGNVGEWCWDDYDGSDGARKINRGGGWNDFAKHMRCAYRASLAPDRSSPSVGIRLARNAAAGSGSLIAKAPRSSAASGENKKVLVAYFSWGGTTRGIAQEVSKQSGGTIFEIEPVNPYSDSYNSVLDEAQRDQRRQARPELKKLPDNMDEYGVILLGYPNWWASIPMPVASFLEKGDFAGKLIVPFCSHGGGRLGQSVTAISKLVPNAVMGEPLSVHYSGGSSLPREIAEWLSKNGIH